MTTAGLAVGRLFRLPEPSTRAVMFSAVARNSLVVLPFALALPPGTEARILLDALPEFVIPATVTFVSPQAQFTPKQVETRGERERLIWAMEQCGWVQAKAARLLRVTPRQLGYALLKHRIEVRKF